MAEPIEIAEKDLSRSRFTRVRMSGASFSCMNIGEDRARLPVSFKEVELDDYTFDGASFAGARTTGANPRGTTIDGLSVPDMINDFKRMRDI